MFGGVGYSAGVKFEFFGQFFIFTGLWFYVKVIVCGAAWCLWGFGVSEE